MPEPWDPDLLYHYRTLMDALQSNLGAYGDSTNTWRRSDYVEVVPVAMPTEVGSEMPLAFGKGTYTGAYGGRTGTWDVHDTNQAEWYSAASGSTNAERLAWLQDSIGQAWKDAVSAQEAVLTSVPSSVAYGGVLGDGMATARWIASNDVPQYGKPGCGR